MARKRSKKRREFEKRKRERNFYDQFGGKQKEKEIHHKKELSENGNNEDENLIMLAIFWHRYYHKMKSRNEILKPKWGKRKNPSIEKTVDIISDALLRKHIQEMNIENLRKHIDLLRRYKNEQHTYS